MIKKLKKVCSYSLCLIMAMSIIAHSQTINAETLSNSIIAISAGAQTVILKSDGTVSAWADFNLNGNLGNGTTDMYYGPVQVKGLNGVTAISSGLSHIIALKNDGTVWGWGSNYYGELGKGTENDISTSIPVQVNALNNVIAISSGFNHTIALKGDGTVWAWGQNNFGQLGDGVNINRSIPVQVSGLSGIIAISTLNNHTLALKNDGTVWAWGENDYGQLGDGTNINSSKPVLVKGLSGKIKEISAGEHHSVVLKEDGTIWSWGSNFYNQLGDGTNINRSTPVQAVGVSNISDISAGAEYTASLKKDGTVWGMGDNRFGQLGDGTKDMRSTPVQVTGLSNIKSIFTSYQSVFAIAKDNTVWGWGEDCSNTLGDSIDGSFRKDKLTPIHPAFLDYIYEAPLYDIPVEIGISTGDNYNSVTKDMILPTSGEYGTTISWESSDASIISTSGSVHRPDYSNGDAKVTLSYTIKKVAFHYKKDIIVTVIKNPPTDAERVKLDAPLVVIGYKEGDSQTNVTQNITLPPSGPNDTKISWNSSNPSIVSNEGIVKRPNYASGDIKVVLNAYITKGSTSEQKTFELTIKAMPKETQTTNPSNIELPKTGASIDYSVLNLIGVSFMLLGIIISKNKRLS